MGVAMVLSAPADSKNPLKIIQFKEVIVFRRRLGCIFEPCGDTHSGFHDPQAPSTNQPAFPGASHEEVPAV